MISLRVFLIICTICMYMTGCSQKKPVEPQVQYLEHTVKYPGETLSIIAKWYTGNNDNWKILADSNPNIKPNRMRIGDVILVPDNILVTSDPLPKKILRSTSEASNEKSTQAAKPAKQPQQPESAPAANTETQAQPAVEAVEEEDEQVLDTNLFEAEEPKKQEGDNTVVESLTLEPTPLSELSSAAEELPQVAASPTLTPQEKAKEDLIDELLKE